MAMGQITRSAERIS